MKSQVDVLFFCGQSNMQGQAEKLTADNAIVKNAFEYRFLADKLKPLQNPVGENISPDGKEGNLCGGHWDRMKNNCLLSSFQGRTNLVPKFCQAYTKGTGKEVVAVHCAKGDTRIEFWLPHTGCFDMTVAKGKRALQTINETYEIRNRYLIWLQGESNQIYKTSRQAYKSLLMEIKDGFKKELSIDKFAIIKVGNYTGDEYGKEIQLAQEDICKEDNDFYMLTEVIDDLFLESRYINPEALGHLSSDGLEKLGEIAGTNLGRFANNNEQ
jgi:hypothetical protein